MPSEAEWEYAARGGTQAKYHYGDDNEGQIDDYGWCDNRAWDKGARTVGQLQPNQYGLYDMMGNVWEWVEDDYVDNYQQGRLQDAYKNAVSRVKVLRGGSWSFNLWDCRSADRDGISPFNSGLYGGLRVVRVAQ